MKDQVQDLCDIFFDLGRDVLSTEVEARDKRGAKTAEDWLPLWHAAAQAGAFGLVLPREYGGMGLPMLDAVRILHRLGEGCRDNGLLLAINGQLWAMQMSIFEFGSDAQKARWLPAMIDGSSICAHAVTEVNSGSDVTGIEARAEKIDGGYRITGEKIWIGMAPGATVAQVFAMTNPDVGYWGMSAFLVDLNAPGITRSAPFDKVGHCTVPTGKLTLDRVEIPDDALLGREGSGHAIFTRSIDWERRFIFSSHIGAMKRMIEETVAFTKSRAPGGVPIATHQSVENRLADMQLRYEHARLMIEHAAREADAGIDNRMTAPLAKLGVAEALLDTALDAQRIRGGEGYLTGEPERMVRDMSGAITLGGTSDIQRRLIAAYQRAGL